MNLPDMENRCITCIHWRLPDREINEFFGAEDMAMPLNPADPDNDWERIESDDDKRKLFGYVTKYCRSPKLKFYERPAKTEACMADGSEYMGVLITGEDFGCVNWEQKVIPI